MTDDDGPVDAEQRSAAVLGIIYPPLQAMERGLHQPRPEGGSAVGAHLAADLAGQEIGERLPELEQHVTGEAVGDDHVHRPSQDVSALHVSHEVESALREELVGRDRQIVALPRLLADREEPDPGPRSSQDLHSVDVAHEGELREMVGLALGVGARVQHDAGLGLGGEDDHDRGTRNALDTSEGGQCGGHHRARVPRRDEGVGETPLLQADAHGDRRAPLPAQRRGRGLLHADDLRRVEHGQPPGAGVAGKQGGESGFIAHEDDLEVALRLAERGQRAGDGPVGGVVATHCVDCDPHARRRSLAV